MNVIEETIEATLDSNGQLRLSQQPRLPPGPVHVTIRVAAAVGPQRGLADVIREIAAEQRSRGSPGGWRTTCAPKTTRAWPRTPSGIENWMPRAAGPRGGRECFTTWIL
jgi:hypothetical protein